MSIYDLTDENRAVRERARSFAEEEISPNLAGWEERDEFPHEVIRRMGRGLKGGPECLLGEARAGVSGEVGELAAAPTLASRLADWRVPSRRRRAVPPPGSVASLSIKAPATASTITAAA